MKGMRTKECLVKKILGLTEPTTIGEIPEEETVDFDVEAWDDVTGKALFQRRRGRGAIRQHAAGGVEVPDQCGGHGARVRGLGGQGDNGE